MTKSEQTATPGARALDWVNFLLADVRGAVGPYLNVFLLTRQHWNQSAIGLVTMVGGLLALVVQTPIGAAIDAIRAKRGAIILGLVVLAFSGTAITVNPHFWTVMIANAAMAMAGAIFGPAIAAITLGLFTRDALARRLGRNSAFDHGGNVVIAILAGGVGWAFSQRTVFLLVPLFSALAAVAVFGIPAAAIDHERARGLDPENQHRDEGPSGLMVLAECRPLLVFGVCAMLFHFANAPLLPLVGQKLALAHKEWATAMMSACIIAAQMVMLPIALAVGNNADRWGRKPIFLAGFGILPIRAILYTLSNNSAWLIGVQLLDGVGAGIFGALTPLILADLMRGTGRYNLALGAVATLQGIGVSLSGFVAGVVVDRFGFSGGFVGLGAVAAIAFLVFAIAMPETAKGSKKSAQSERSPARLSS